MSALKVVREPVLRFATTDGRTEWTCLECGVKWSYRLFDDAVKEALRHQRLRHGAKP